MAKYGASEKFYFSQQLPRWKVAKVSDTSEDIDLGGGPGPSRLVVDLFAPGFMLRFPKGFELKLRSTSAPYLSWKEGSVGEHVPTPNVRWIGVSFRTGQPPLVLGFVDGEVSLQVDGAVGNWTLHTQKPYLGWVRVALPFGTRPMATDSAASLGKLSMAIAASNELWWRPAPKLKNVTLSDEDTAVQATWLFDRRGVVVPSGAALANLGHYPLEIKTKTRRLEGYTEEGPTTVAEEDALTIRFPIVRIPLGRAITVGPPRSEPIGTVSAFDVGTTVDLAFENLLASRDVRSRDTAQSALAEFIQGTDYILEPHSNQRLPFAADGKGLDVIAANALLFQACSISSRPGSDDNSLLTSIEWRRDWYSWRIWTDDGKLSRRAGALSAMAGALCSEPERRLGAAMVQAGLAAERGLGVFLSRQAGKLDEPKLLEPIAAVRNTIFDMNFIPRRRDPFVISILGDIRVFGDASVTCSRDLVSGYTVNWDSAPSVTLASGFPMTVAGFGVKGSHVLGFTEVLATVPGTHLATISPPAWVRPLPAFVAPPTYDEPIN